MKGGSNTEEGLYKGEVQWIMGDDHMGPHCGQTDRYTAANMHYLPATSLAGGKTIDISEPIKMTNV